MTTQENSVIFRQDPDRYRGFWLFH